MPECVEPRLNGVARVVGIAQTVDDYTLVFDVWSDGNDCAASDMVRAPRGKVWGVLYDIPDDFVRGRREDGKRTLEQIEWKRYCEAVVRVRLPNGKEHDAVTFVVRDEFRQQGLKTNAEYVSRIVQGLREQGVSEHYIREVKEIAASNNPVIREALQNL